MAENWAPQALTLDLDDTLWPVWPTIARAERMLRDWLIERAPATIALHDQAAMATLRRQVVHAHPDWAHDLSALRRETIRRALLAGGDDPALAEPAFEVFFAARQQVTLYDDALPALQRLAARWPIVAVSNGNADLARVGLAQYFVAAFSARQFGVGKPAAGIFHAACAAARAAPDRVLHVGDDPALDVDGALAAGLRAAWVQRQTESAVAPAFAPATGLPAGQLQAVPQGAPHFHVASLTELADHLGA